MITNTVAENTKQVPKVIWPVFIFSIGLITFFVIYGLMTKNQTDSALLNSLTMVMDHLAWLYLLLGFIGVLLCLWLCFSKWGNIRFGDVDDKPDFGTLSWVGMICTACIATSIMFWGSTEWVFYYTSPPFHLEPRSIEAAEFAASYGMFHWGFTAWAIYALPTLPLAYLIYNRKRTLFRISMALTGVVNERYLKGNIAAFIDGLMVLGQVGGICVALGTGPAMISLVLGSLFNFQPSLVFDVCLISSWVVLFFICTTLGMERGMKNLSNLNLIVAIGFFILVLILGPTLFILKGFTNSVGVIVHNYIKMSLWTDPFGSSRFPEDWTGFFWIWWMVAAPFMAIFMARISKGRTVRELILANMLGGTLVCALGFSILGNTAMYLELNGLAPIINSVLNENLSSAVSKICEALPLSGLMMILFCLSAFTFMATTFNSIAYGAATVCSEKTAYDHEPALWVRMVWALALGCTAVTLRVVGGLPILKVGAGLTGIPIVVIILIMIISFFKWAKEDHAPQVHTRFREEMENR